MTQSLSSLTKHPGWTRSEKIELVAKYKRSGLSQRKFCETAGIKFSTFRNWLSYFRAKGLSNPSPQLGQFEPVVVLPEESPSVLTNPAHSPLQQRAHSFPQNRDRSGELADPCLEVRLPTLSIIVPRGFHEGTLRRLIQIGRDLHV